MDKQFVVTSCLHHHHQPPPESVLVSRTVAHSRPLAVDMSGVDGGAAKRRRERRLGSMLRHERMTVAVELAAALHHSCGLRPDATCNAPRGQKTASSAGARPGVLEDPEPAQVGCAWASSLLPLLAANDALDHTGLKFLVARALLEQREQEEEEVKKRKKDLLERLTAEGRRELEQRLDSG